jgi:VanZ family protein
MISFLLSVRQLFRIFLTIFYVGCIVALSLLPNNDFPRIELFEGADKVVHFLMYFIFSLLFCWTTKTESNYSRLFFIIPVTIGWGIFMEFMQLSMHQGRSFSVFDILANSLGVISGTLIYLLVTRKIFS